MCCARRSRSPIIRKVEMDDCSWESGTTFQIDRCKLNSSRNYYGRSNIQFGIWHNIPDWHVSWTAAEIITEDQTYSWESGTTFQIDRCKLTSVELITEDQTCSWESGTTYQIDRCLLNISGNYYRRSDRQLGIWHTIFRLRCKLNISGHYYRRSNRQLGEKMWQKQEEDTEVCCKAKQGMNNFKVIEVKKK